MTATNKYEHDYLMLINKVVNEGDTRSNRTSIYTKSLTAQQIRADLRVGFPALTSRKMPFKSTMGELKGFVEGATSAKRFRELGCAFWDKDANENGDWLRNPHRQGQDDLGLIYGVQWRAFGGQIDQLQDVVNQMTMNPTSRRIVCMAWNPVDVGKCAVPPCHMGFHIVLNPATREADLVLWMRSCDTYLGLPANMMSYAALLHCLCYISGNWSPREVVINMDDCHVYSNHFPQVQELLNRTVYELPRLRMTPPPRSIDAISTTQFELENYVSCAALSGVMATTPI